MFYWRFLVVAIPVVFVALGLHLADRAVTLEKWQQQMESQIKSVSGSLTADFHEVAIDAVLLAEDSMLQLRSERALEVLAERFDSLAHHKPNYQQIRFIDTAGMERLRINSNADRVWRVPERELQNKSGRDYFQEAINLPRHSIRISALDLNIEHGQIERPLNPMLRFSAPVSAADGKRLGVIVINYGVGPVLAKLFDAQDTSGLRKMLLNQNGAWLGGGAEADRWGGLLDHGRTFRQAYAQAWTQFPTQENAALVQWSSEQVQGAALRLVPTDFVRADIAGGRGMGLKVGSADPFWLAVVEADNDTIYAAPNERLIIGLILLSGGLVLWAFAMRGWGKLKILSMEAMKEANKLAKVVEMTTDHILITDPDGSIDYVNPAFCQATGYEKREVIGQTPRILKSGQHTQAFYQDVWARIKRGETIQELFVNRRKDSELYYEEKTISPLLDDTGQITSFISTGKDISGSKVTRMAFYDSLTGLANRALFLDRLQHEIEHAQRTGQTVAVMFLDLDGFKAVNDEFGHDAGDNLLIEFSRRVGLVMRRSDTLARFGGDEFAALLKDVKSAADAEEVASKILQETKEPWRLGKIQVNIGVSIGISFYPSEAIDSNELLKRADQAMYQAKQFGKNRYFIYNEGRAQGT